MPSGQLVDVAGRRLRLSNLDKVLYPDSGTTKGDIIAYYTAVAPVMLPHLSDRPVTRKRWVDGVGTKDAPAQAFFAKRLEPGAPDWVARTTLEHDTGAKDYPLVNDLPTLVWLAQIASIELHVPQWRVRPDQQRASPDRLVLDLDPGPGVDLPLCAHVARLARDILRDIGLDPVPVTSGSSGIHLYSPLDGRHTSEDASALAHELARAIEADHPDLATSTMAKSARSGRVFLDWSQNNRSKTTISPYSLRGRATPTVAAPRTWDELADDGLRQLRWDEVIERVSAGIDPLAALRRPDVDSLAAYRGKRRAARTPEPIPETSAPAPASSGPVRFVIQEHHARRRHFDLRIEHDGVLLSWAVPKGVPQRPALQRLAVMTEPHPLEYLNFHGEIPRGEYGAGTMTIWDSGTVEIEKWRDDEVIGTFHGTGPLGTARLALIRTDGAGEKSSWLLHRMTPAAHPVEAGAGGPGQDALLRPMLAEAGTPARAGQREDAWAEIKWDGIRAIGSWRNGRLRLRSRNGADITARYPELTASGAVALPAAEATLDGEIVALDPSGRPSFSLLQNRMHRTDAREIEREARTTPVRYHLFDLLHLDGVDLTARPLRERRALLETLAEQTEGPLVVPPVLDDVDTALEVSRRLGLEGIVVKDAASVYRPGQRSGEWLKIAHTRTQEVVVVGIRPGRGNRAGTIGSLLLAVPDGPDAALRYVGRVGTGFTDRALRDLQRRLEPLRTAVPPLAGVPAPDARDALWVRPLCVAEVEFAGWTPGGMLRHARWRGERADKTVSDIVVTPRSDQA